LPAVSFRTQTGKQIIWAQHSVWTNGTFIAVVVVSEGLLLVAQVAVVGLLAVELAGY
jgi:hypothetical protein